MITKTDELKALALIKEIHDLYAVFQPYVRRGAEMQDKEGFDALMAIKAVQGDTDATEDILLAMMESFSADPARQEEYKKAVRLRDILLSLSRSKTAEETVTGCLEARLAWYKKAAAIAKREVPYENGFDWPAEETDNPLSEWTGAIRELQNTIDMLHHYQKPEKQQNIYVLIEYNDTAIISCAPYEMYLNAKLAMETAYHGSISQLDESEYMSESTFIESERACIDACDADDSCCWEICETRLYDPEAADILLDYNKKQIEWWAGVEPGDRRGLLISENVTCPGGYSIFATYSPLGRCMWFSVNKDSEQSLGYLSALKWCVSQGLQHASNLDQAERILQKIDKSASFNH